MTVLYAIPEADAVRRLLPAFGERRLTVDDARHRLAANPNLLPLAIDEADGGWIGFADFGEEPLSDWQHIFTIQRLAAAGRFGEVFVAPLELLAAADLPAGGMDLSGFIFHVSRCGSTLLGKALARSPARLVVNQPAPLQWGFWAALTGGFAAPLEATARHLTMFRNLCRLLTRPRGGRFLTAHLKLISWNTIYIDFVQRAFPAAARLFLYRDPVEVIASVRHETTAALYSRRTRLGGLLAALPQEAADRLDDLDYLAACYAHYLASAEAAGPSGLRWLNYRDFSAERLPAVLAAGLRIDPDDSELALMRAQFAVHSKDDSGRRRFSDDRARKQAALSADERARVARCTAALMQSLDASRYNIVSS